MRLGEVIRKYRKDLNMTQEEMAGRLGVTAPAVNKWESGASMPDIALLAPIARLLGITTDTLLSFQEGLTSEEIASMVREVDAKLKEEPYDQVFQWARKQWAQYPNCDALIYQLALILDTQRVIKEIPHPETYDEELCALYERALNGREESIRNLAADALFGFYLRKGQYQKAEGYLSCFSRQDPERKRKQAQLYEKTGQRRQARKAYEELLFACYQMANAALIGLYMMALQDGQTQEARGLSEKQSDLARCFEMGRYYEACCRLEMAARDKDADRTIEIMKEMLAGVEDMDAFCRAPLYAHMVWRPIRQEFILDMKKTLLNGFRDEESFGFLRKDRRWQKIVGKDPAS